MQIDALYNWCWNYHQVAHLVQLLGKGLSRKIDFPTLIAIRSLYHEMEMEMGSPICKN